MVSRLVPGRQPWSAPALRPGREAYLTTGAIQLPMRSRPMTTMATSSSPIQNCQ